MKRLLLPVLAMLFIVSCSHDDEPAPPENSVSTELRGLEGARQRLAKIVATPEFRSQLKTKDNPMGLATVAETTMFDRHGDMLTRAEEDSANVYVFEFEGGGFAVLGEAPYMPDLLAFSPDGGSLVNDSLDWDPLSSLIGSNGVIVPPSFGDGEPTKNYQYDKVTYTYLNGYEPIRVQWGQEDGYNDYCNGNKAGCGPVAVAITMTHPTGRPYSYDGFAFNWTEMLNYSYSDAVGTTPSIGRQHVNRLIEMIGRPENLNVTYRPNATSTNPENIPRAFRNFGYSNGGEIKTYNFDMVKIEISGNHPVICLGYTGSGLDWGIGHGWVISSIVEERLPYIVTDPDTGIVLSSGVDVFYLAHCNWGWYGNRNGFYIKNCFDTSEGPMLNDDKEPVDNPDTGYDFGNHMSIVINIRK